MASASATSSIDVSRTAKKVLRENGLSLVAAALFLASTVAMVFAGYAAYNEELHEHGRAGLSFASYLTSGHFLEAIFENWESEFLQMGLFVVLTACLYQKGSAESKPLDESDPAEQDPRKHVTKNSPWPVRRGGLALKLYEHSLSIGLLLMFLATFVLHGLTGLRKVNAEHALHGEHPVGLSAYVGSSDFWFESFQNWQSEFLAVLAIVVMSIFLRQRGSAQSKPVAAPHGETAD
jgi:hypothetical protein